jgi:hypothetical protein
MDTSAPTAGFYHVAARLQGCPIIYRKDAKDIFMPFTVYTAPGMEILFFQFSKSHGKHGISRIFLSVFFRVFCGKKYNL